MHSLSKPSKVAHFSGNVSRFRLREMTAAQSLYSPLVMSPSLFSLPLTGVKRVVFAALLLLAAMSVLLRALVDLVTKDLTPWAPESAT